MPTVNRAAFVAQSITYFQAQQYPNKELIIVDESSEHVLLDVHTEQNIRYIHVTSDMRLSIGAKRNLACALAQGTIIAHWDDDDYYGPLRLERQAAPILAGEADVTAMRMSLLLDAREGQLWECSESMHQSLFAHNVRASTLMYRASYWQTGWQYPNKRIGEDVFFLDGLLARGARLAHVVSPESYICVRHGENTTDDIEGLSGWRKVEMHQYMAAEDRAFYAALRREEQL